MRRRKSISILALLIGTALGVLGGIFFAPTKGANLRSIVSYRIRRYSERLQELIKTLTHTKQAVSSQAKAASQGIIDETIQKAQQLLKDADELADTLD